MVMMEYFANTPACAPGDFACALRCADTDVLASVGSAFGDIAGGVGGVKSDQIARAFPNTLSRRSSTLRGSFADVSGASAHVATGAALMGMLLRGRLRCVGRLGLGLGLAVLTSGAQAAGGQCECQEGGGCFWECGSHRLRPLTVGFEASPEDFFKRHGDWQVSQSAGALLQSCKPVRGEGFSIALANCCETEVRARADAIRAALFERTGVHQQENDTRYCKCGGTGRLAR
jgi:hypothetical protein